ncbi:MAG TPA: hypothetical protein VFG84_07650 [Gemmatimonadaceae bacterium]|nr:hypothetical protein [Gemmatimonadaceae bacterium]
MSHAHHPSDRKAAFIGMIVTMIAIFVVCFTIVELTNKKYEGHAAEAAATH